MGTAASYVDFSNSDRCLMSGNAGRPMLPGVYNNNMQLFQTPDHVAVMNEMMHTVRVVPLVVGIDRQAISHRAALPRPPKKSPIRPNQNRKPNRASSR